MKNYTFLGVDISKNSISVYDGKKSYKVPNERYLTQFKGRVLKNFNKEEVVLIYEPTGMYSAFFEEFCAIEGARPPKLCLYYTSFNSYLKTSKRCKSALTALTVGTGFFLPFICKIYCLHKKISLQTFP